MMLHTKYQSSRPCGFRQEDFFMFVPITGWAHFWSQEQNLNQFGRGLNTKYQGSRPCGFRQEYFFMSMKSCDHFTTNKKLR